MVHRGGFPNPADIHYSGPCLVMCNVWQCNCVRCLHPCMVTRYSAGGGDEAESGNQSVVTDYTISTQHPACAGSAGVQQSARYAGHTRRLGGEGDSCQSGLIVRYQALIVTSSPATWDMRYHTLGLGLAFLSPPPCVDISCSVDRQTVRKSGSF